VSSSSSATEARSATRRASLAATSVGDLLREALELVRADVPPCYEQARRALEGRVVACRIDDEAFVVTFTAREIVVGPSNAGAAIDVEVSRLTILSLLRNERPFHGAVLTGDLAVRGAIDVLARLGEAMHAFLHGAVRSPRMPPVLARFVVLCDSTHG
jgi:hypothetical protein